MKNPWVTEITPDSIKHFVWGIGDDNPLWLDPHHCSSLAWNGTIAPPSFAYANHDTVLAPGYEGYERHYQTVNWEWYQNFEIGDQITSQAKLLKEVGDPSSEIIEQWSETNFSVESKGLVARSTVMIKRDKNPLPEINQREEIRYDSDELLRIEERILSESRRGVTQVHGGEVSIGETIGTITKGPLSIMDIVAWCAGTQGAPDSDIESSSGGLETQAASGPQLTSWVIHLITNWMGDKGFLKSLSASFADLPFLGSTTTITGQITKIIKDDSGYLCDADITCHLQNNELIAEGTAIIHLPNEEDL